MLGIMSIYKAMDNFKFNNIYKQSAFYIPPRSKRIKSKKHKRKKR